MRVPVCVDQATREWSLLEFQGELLASDGAQEVDMRALELGSLRFGDGGEITLRIGNHILSGKQTALAKPFAILRKDTVAAEENVDIEMHGETAGRVGYQVVGIARTRVIFGVRPKPVLT